ncbi:MAG: GGDEF domain-containing protein [Pseudomonas sp.]|uniref:GGDEF domain-containing protein n=1 Tax=Pseudomonas sp. TaxID=306 RepID=UPI003398878B
MQPSRNQLLRIRRTLMASSASLLHLLLCWLAYAGGFMQLSLAGMGVLSFVVCASCLVMLLLMWLNLNLRFHDPSLTLPQMAWAIALVFVTAYFADGQRFLFLMMALMALMFGAFSLDLRGFVKIGLFTTICYGLLVGALARRDGALELRVEGLQAMAFFVLMAGMSMLGLEMSGLRRTLQERNRDLNQALERIQQLVITDEVTGLYNRRFARELLAQQKALADRGTYRFVLCMIELDHFKTVNERYGHTAGEGVLNQLARHFEQAIRDVDFAARIGHEEFLLVLSQTDIAGALQMLERLREAIAGQQWQGCPELHLTLSVGVSGYCTPEPWAQSLQRADHALQKAKAEGRDQVVVL